MPTFNNPIAYGKSYAAQNVDAFTHTAVSTTTVYNGSLVTLGQIGTGAAEGMGYVYPATLTAATTGNTNDVWMVRAPEVPMDVCGNLYDDPRAFEIPAGRPFDVIKLVPGDVIQLSNTAFGSNTVASATAGYAYSDENGQWQAANTAAAVTGMVAKFQLAEPIVVGQEYVPGVVVEIIQNPTATLA